MANVVVANVGAFAALCLALMWTVSLTRPWTWLCSENSIVLFKVNLLEINIAKGTLGHVGSLFAQAVDKAFGTKAGESLDGLFDQRLWMEEGVQELCMVGIDSIWHWCEDWVMVKYGSMLFLFFGLVTVVFLAMGGSYLYYYAHYRATHTGRKWIKACFIAAPSCACIGLLQYTVLTLRHGKGGKLMETHSSYGAGFVVACVLTLFTFAPLYIIAVWAKVYDFEKIGANNACTEENGALGASYGAA